MTLRPLIAGALLISAPALLAAEEAEPSAGEVLEAEAREAERDDIHLDPGLRALIGFNEDVVFSMHNPVYALAGEDLKLRYGFKLKPVTSFDLYLAYDTIIVWDIDNDSLPFDGMDFMPEMFYRWELPWENAISVDAGWHHRSNGEDVPDSRSLDRWFGRLNTAWPLGERALIYKFTLFVDKRVSPDNPDIGDYWGDTQHELILGNIWPGIPGRLDALATIVPGESEFSLDRGWQTYGLQYTPGGDDVNIKFYLEHFHGHGQLIRDYRTQEEVTRFGVSFYF